MKLKHVNVKEYNGSTGKLYLMVDHVTEKCFPIVEYENHKVLFRAMAQLKLPPGLSAGDIEVYHIADRDGSMVYYMESDEPVWSCPSTSVQSEDISVLADRRIVR